MNELGEAMRIVGLRKESARAWAEVDRLKERVSVLESENAMLKRIVDIDSVSGRLYTLENENERLRAEVNALNEPLVQETK